MEYCLSGFNSERPDPVGGHYHLGNGYRSYSPMLGRFITPDSWSPFKEGGINPYIYCEGDPVNRADPSGHFSLGQWIGMGVGFITGIALSIVTEGSAMPVALSLLATLTGETAIGAGTELATEAIDGERIRWGQIGMAASLSAVTALLGFGTGKVFQRANHLYETGVGYVMRKLSKLKRVNNGLGIPLSGGAEQAGRKMAAGMQSGDFDYLTYIHDDNIFSHEINFMNNPYKIRSRRIGYENETFFTNEYHPDEWIFQANFRSKNEFFYTSQMIEYQFLRVKELNNFSSLPKRLVASMVMNEEVLNATAGKTGAELLEAYFGTTVGKAGLRIFDKFKFNPTHIVRENDCPGLCADFIIYLQ